MLRIQHTKSPGQRRPGLQVLHSEEVSSEGSLAEALSCAKECGRRPHAILVADPLKLIKPLQHPGRSGISRHHSRCIIECQRHQGFGDTNCSGLDRDSRKTVRAFFVVFGGQHCRLIVVERAGVLMAVAGGGEISRERGLYAAAGDAD